MTDLATVLAPRPKKKGTTDPNVRTLRRLARLGWNGWAHGPHDRCTIVRQYDDGVWQTDTYGMRRWASDSPEGVALLSMIPDVPDRDDIARSGYVVRLLGTRDPEYVGAKATEMAGVMPTDLSGRERVTDWRPDDDLREHVVATAGDREVLLDAKKVRMCTDGLTDVDAWIENDRRPVVFTSGGRIVSILMPRRR